METQLFEHLFPSSHPSSGALSPLIDSLADMLYDTLRPAYIHLQDLNSLCQLVLILTNEVSSTRAQITLHTLHVLGPAILKLVLQYTHNTILIGSCGLSGLTGGLNISRLGGRSLSVVSVKCLCQANQLSIMHFFFSIALKHQPVVWMGFWRAGCI